MIELPVGEVRQIVTTADFLAYDRFAPVESVAVPAGTRGTIVMLPDPFFSDLAPELQFPGDLYLRHPPSIWYRVLSPLELLAEAANG